MSKKILALLISIFFLLNGCAMFGAQTTPTPKVTAPALEKSAITAQGRLLPRKSIVLTFSTGGKVAEVLVEEGDVVKQGQVLARMENQASLLAAVAAAEFELSNARQGRQALKDNLDAERNQALEVLNLARQARRTAEQRLDDLEDNDDNDELVALAETDLKVTQEKVRLAEKLVNQLTMGPNPELVKAAEARITNAEAQLAATRDNLTNLSLTAPMDGTVVNLNLSAGEWIAPGAPAAQLADMTTWIVETEDLTEIDVVRVSVGQAVIVTPDALPGLELRGEVIKIGNTPTERFGDITYTLQISLEKIDPRLRWGMTVTITFMD